MIGRERRREMGGPVVLVAARDQEVRRWLASALALRGIECRTVSGSGELQASTGHPLVVITERADAGAGASAPPVMVMLPLEREQAIPRIERLVAQRIEL